MGLRGLNKEPTEWYAILKKITRMYEMKDRESRDKCYDKFL